MATLNIADKYTTTQKKTEQYSDFGVDLQAHPAKKDLIRLTNETAIKRSILNILLTNYHERFYRPYLGSNLRSLLFEPATPDTLTTLRQYITTAIAKFEPRVRITSITTTLSQDELQIFVSMVFNIINTSAPVTLNFILNRVR